MQKIINLDLIDIIPVNSSAFCLKVPGAKFKAMYYRSNSQTYCNVYPEEYNKDLEITFNKDVFVVPYIEKYFHNLLEILPRVLFLKSINPFFHLVICSTKETDLNEKRSMFTSWEKPKEDNNHNLSNIKEFLDMSGISYTCTSTASDFFKNMVARSAYVFFDLKSTATRGVPNFYPPNYKFLSSQPYHPLTSQTSESVFPFLDILKESFNIEAISYKNIYISRKNFPERRLENEDKLEEFLSDCGYEIVHFETMSIRDQIKVVRESKKIITINGSSLVNCMFANPETEIVAFNNNSAIIGIYKAACKEYNIKYNLVEMPNNDASWAIDYLKSNNIV